MVILDHVDVERLAATAQSLTGRQMDRALILMLGYVGLRINEALALQVSNLDLTARRATIMQTWSQGTVRYLGTPKSGKPRTVSLPRFLVAELRPLVEHQPADAFVFRGTRGGYVHESNWRGRVWAKAVSQAGLAPKNPTPHDLRHAAASMIIASGADVKVVQLQLGHARATETLDVYAHLWPDRLDVMSVAVELARADALRPPAPAPESATDETGNAVYDTGGASVCHSSSRTGIPVVVVHSAARPSESPRRRSEAPLPPRRAGRRAQTARAHLGGGSHCPVTAGRKNNHLPPIRQKADSIPDDPS